MDFRRHSLFCSQKAESRTVLPCLRKDPAQSWNITTLHSPSTHSPLFLYITILPRYVIPTDSTAPSVPHFKARGRNCRLQNYFRVEDLHKVLRSTVGKSLRARKVLYYISLFSCPKLSSGSRSKLQTQNVRCQASTKQ